MMPDEQKMLNRMLYDAASAVDPDKVETLLNKGANPNAPLREDFPRLPLHAVMYKKNNAPSGNVWNVIRLLLRAGADPDVSDPGHKLTPLCDAAIYNIDIVKLLLEHGADPNHECAAGLLPLQTCRYTHIIEELMLNKADPLRKNSAGRSSLAHHSGSGTAGDMIECYARLVRLRRTRLDANDLVDEKGKATHVLSLIFEFGLADILTSPVHYLQGMQGVARIYPHLPQEMQAEIDLSAWRRSTARLDPASAVARYLTSQNPDQERRP